MQRGFKHPLLPLQKVHVEQQRQRCTEQTRIQILQIKNYILLNLLLWQVDDWSTIVWWHRWGNNLTCCNPDGIYPLGNLGPLPVYLSSLSSKLLKIMVGFSSTAMWTTAAPCSKRISHCADSLLPWATRCHCIEMLFPLLRAPCLHTLREGVTAWLSFVCIHNRKPFWAFQNKGLKKAPNSILAREKLDRQNLLVKSKRFSYFLVDRFNSLKYFIIILSCVYCHQV